MVSTRFDFLRRTRRWTFSAAAVAVVTLAAPSATPAAAAQAPARKAAVAPGLAYAAFGDSYSAGEGTNDYIPGTAIPGVNVCHRSPLAYSGVLDAEHPLGRLGFAACSGAVTDDMFHPNSNGNRAPDGQREPAQLCTSRDIDSVTACGGTRDPVLGPQTRTVTLTIGGNDLGFAKIVAACAFVTIGKYHVGLPGRGCSIDPAITVPAAKRLAALDGVDTVQSPYGTTIHSWGSVLSTIHAIAPNAHVYLAGYPKLFQQQSTADCVIGTANGSAAIHIAASDATWIDHGVAVVDASIAYAAAAAGPWATYVDPEPTFTGHGLCSTNPWINPITETVRINPLTGKITTISDPGSVHPTIDGQRLGYAQAFTSSGLIS